MSVDLVTRRSRRRASSTLTRHPRTFSDTVGLVLPNWIGDVVMATPALRSLRTALGTEANLIGVMNPIAAEVLEGTDFLDDVVLYQRRTLSRGLLSVAAELRSRRLDSLILFTNSFSAAVLGWLTRTPHRIGFQRYARGPLLTTRLEPPRRDGRLLPISAVDYYLELARSVGGTSAAPQLELAVTAADRAAVDLLFARLSVDTSRPLVTLNNGGGYGTAKKWPVAQLIRLAERLAAESGASVLVVGGPAERADLATIDRSAGSDRIHTLARVEPAIGITKACVERSDVLVSTDSGVRHFAAAFDVPCVSLFGPTAPQWSENYHVSDRHLRADVPCAPCGRRACPLRHHRCMRDLSVDRVFRAVVESLARMS